MAEPGEPSPLRRHSPNGYGLLRLVLASLVILQHALALTGNVQHTFVGFLDLVQPASYGELAVGGFFALSGFLLQASVERNAPSRFLRLRCFRLFPGFWAMLVVVAFILAPLVAWMAGTLSQYQVLGPDSAITYVFVNAGLLMVQPSIGGVVSANPYPYSLNGSPWTLLPEFTCYVTMLGVASAGLLLRRPRWAGPAIMAAGSLVIFWFAQSVLPGEQGHLVSQLAGLPATFFIGSLIAILHLERRATNTSTAAVLAITFGIIGLGLWLPLGPPALAVSVVFTGAVIQRGWASRVGTRTDLSYGIYLYHFPVIQLLIAAEVPSGTPAQDLLIISPLALLLTLPLAAASWHFVESPAQSHARRRRTPVEQDS